MQAPRLYATALNDPMLTEAWDTQPNAGLGGRRLRSLTGSTLGGSSAVNGLQWTKPPLATFDTDTWAFNGVPRPSPRPQPAELA